MSATLAGKLKRGKRPKNLEAGGDDWRDRFQTPCDDGFTMPSLLDYLPTGKTIWEPACGEGYMVDYLVEQGYGVIGTDILTGHDFLTWEPRDDELAEENDYDLIVTNPPYSLKDQFLKRAFALKKPFAFLVPMTTLEGARRQAMYREHGIQVIFKPKRTNFITPQQLAYEADPFNEDVDFDPGKKSSAWFAVCWLTWGLDLPHDINFWHEGQPKPNHGAVDARKLDMSVCDVCRRSYPTIEMELFGYSGLKPKDYPGVFSCGPCRESVQDKRCKICNAENRPGKRQVISWVSNDLCSFCAGTNPILSNTQCQICHKPMFIEEPLPKPPHSHPACLEWAKSLQPKGV